MLTSALAPRKTAYAGSRQDWESLAQVNPGKVASVAHNNSKRLENALIAAETATVMAIELLIIGGSNVAMSVWDGMNDYKRNLMIDAWRNPGSEAATQLPDVATKAAEYSVANPTADMSKTSPFKEGDFKDPTLVFNFAPKLLIGTGVTGLVAFLARRSPYAYVANAAVVGSLTAWTGSLGHEIGMRIAAKRAAKKEAA